MSKNGAVVLKVNCAGKSSCSGTVTLRTLTAISAAKGKRKAILTLASSSFSVLAGQARALTLRLSAKARAILARLHVLRARATIATHDSKGAANTVPTLVTLRAAKAGGKH